MFIFQPITAEEVQAAENLSTEPSPTSSLKQLEPTPIGISFTKYYMTFLILYISIVNDKQPLKYENTLSLSINSSLEENTFPTRSILRTSILQENRVNEEHVKDLSMHNIGMF